MVDRRLARARVAMFLSLLWLPARAIAQQQAGAPSEIDGAPSELSRISRDQYLARIEQLQAVVSTCKARAASCDAGEAGEDATVVDGDRSFDVRHAWLRDALRDARDESDAERTESMAKVLDRLNADAQEAAPVPADGAPENSARAEVDAILSRGEFRKVQPEGWLDKKWALFGLWLSALTDAFFSRVPHSSWVAPLIEWGLLAAAAVALILWAWRVTRQQRLELSVPDANRQLAWQKESEDWALRADAWAAAEDWREAVHCLYWAAIAMLEGRRFWRPNRARTPREYLPLLEAGSEGQRALSGLTRIFERIWYGLRPAARHDFEQARALLDELKAA